MSYHHLSPQAQLNEANKKREEDIELAVSCAIEKVTKYGGTYCWKKRADDEYGGGDWFDRYLWTEEIQGIIKSIGYEITLTREKVVKVTGLIFDHEEITKATITITNPLLFDKRKQQQELDAAAKERIKTKMKNKFG